MPGWPPFSTDSFLEVVAGTYFPGARAAIVECDGIRVRTLVLRNGRALTGFWQFPSYREPLDAEVSAGARQVPFLDDVVLAVTPAGTPGPRGTVPAPFISFHEFETWEQFLARGSGAPGFDSPKTVLRKTRKLERELGALEFRLEDDDPEVLDTLLRWKVAQFARTRRAFSLAYPQNVEFHRELWRRKLCVTTSLRAGGRLVGGKIGHRVEGRHISRITVYDPDLAGYSPGSILHLQTFEACFRAGDSEFDFMTGGHPYKFAHATHVRWVGSVGREPRIDRWERLARAYASRQLSGRPALGRVLRRADRKLSPVVDRFR